MNMSARKQSLLICSALCLLGFLSGCKEETFVDVRDKVPVVPVTGKILVNGEALVIPQQARIILNPDPETKEKLPTDIPLPSAWTEPDGTTFHIGTYDGGDGAPVGKYKVTIEGGQRSLMNGAFRGGLLNGKYKNPETSRIDLVITGDEGTIDLGPIELTTK